MNNESQGLEKLRRQLVHTFKCSLAHTFIERNGGWDHLQYVILFFHEPVLFFLNEVCMSKYTSVHMLQLYSLICPCIYYYICVCYYLHR